MKTTHILLAAVLAATSAVQAATAERKLPAPLPEFKTLEQLANWRAEKGKGTADPHSTLSIPNSALKNASAFFTGKPFVEETGSYVFKFRQYDSELSRWTTSDPSGFPDGANNSAYLVNPTSQIDFSGLAAKTVINNLTDALEHWSSNAAGTVSASDSEVDPGIRASW